MTDFELHPQLAADTFEIGRLDLSRVLLMNDARYPWIILVPERAALIEFLQLSLDDCATLVRELRRVSAGMLELFRPDKLNIAALGNKVSQLHVHVIARYRGDPTWPSPVWTGEPAPPYPADAAVARVQALRGALRLPA